MKIIIFENNVYIDGRGDYYHLKDILKAFINNLKFKDYILIPMVKVSLSQQFIDMIKKDFIDMGITTFYVSKNLNDSDSEIDEEIQSIYEKADQVIEVSTIFGNKYKKFLKPGAVVKCILEHEKISRLSWKLESNIPTLDAAMGLGKNNLGIKIPALKDKSNPIDFFSTLQMHDSELATKLLNTTFTTSSTEFFEENTFVHAYFNRFDFGFSMFLSLLCAKKGSTNIVIHLSSGRELFIKKYFEEENDNYYFTDFFKKALASLPNANVKHIELYGRDEKIYPVSESGTRIIRIYTDYLSQQSYAKIHDACEIVGVSGDNTLEKCIAHRILPFYHSTNWAMKLPTWRAIKEIIETVNFGFPDEVKSDLISYFSYKAQENEWESCLQLLTINLEEVIKAWPKIADYLFRHKNFYTLFEQLIVMPVPDLEEFKDKKAINLCIQDNDFGLAISTPQELAIKPDTSVELPLKDPVQDLLNLKHYILKRQWKVGSFYFFQGGLLYNNEKRLPHRVHAILMIIDKMEEMNFPPNQTMVLIKEQAQRALTHPRPMQDKETNKFYQSIVDGSLVVHEDFDPSYQI